MDNFQIETAQNIQISQNIASIGDRIIAFIIDILLISAYEMIMMLVFITFNSGNYSSTTELWVVVLVFGLPPFLYHLLMETLNNGQSVGKAALKIRVVKIDGKPLHFSDYLVRWLLRIVDISLSTGAIALFTLLLNGKGQRLGDIAAKTTVISEKKHIGMSDTLLMDFPEDYVPVYPQVTIFSDHDIQEIKKLYKQAKSKSNRQVIEVLAKKVSAIIEIHPEQSEEDFIQQVIKDYNYYTQQ